MKVKTLMGWDGMGWDTVRSGASFLGRRSGIALGVCGNDFVGGGCVQHGPSC